MSPGETRAGDWLSGLVNAYERMLPMLAGRQWLPEQARLVAMLIAGPVVLTPLVVQTLASNADPAIALAAICAMFATSGLLAFLVIEGTPATAVTSAALALAVVLIGVSTAMAGGLSGPAACLLAALPIETYRLTRSARWSALTLIAGVAVAAGVSTAYAYPPTHSPWQWATPALYAALLAARQWAHGRQTRPSGVQLAVLDAAQLDAAVITFGASGEVEAVEGIGKTMLNVDPALLLGHGLFDRIHVADRVAFKCALSDARQAARRSVIELKVRRAADPETREHRGYGLFKLEFVPTAGSDGCVQAVLRDISDVAELRAKLARAIDQASATEIAKGRFLATVSHELRTPLNAIIGFSDLLLHREISGTLTSKQTEHVGLIREAGNHLLSVVNAILDVSKIESGAYQISIEPFHLAPSVELCCAMLKPQAAAKGIELTVKIPNTLPQVKGDQRAIQQILLNLVSNALKFTPAGGSVSVTAAVKGDTVRMFVNDTGIGIAADDLARLGQPFMQVQNDYTRQYQGTGLGLSLVKGLVRLLDGTMSIESAPGLGTTVAIGLPAAGITRDTGPFGRADEQGEGNGVALRRIA